MTAGPCYEPIDPVRYISNRSSGKMGFALAEAARDAGAHVTLVSGPTALMPPQGVEIIPIETTRQMYEEVDQRFDACDCLVMAAAPADFTPAHPETEKIKKAKGPLRVDLAPTVDILAAMGARKGKQVLIGFALETENGEANARAKLKAKNLDLVVLNSPRDEGSAFGYDSNKITVIRPDRPPESWPLLPKSEVAFRLLALIESML